MSPAPKTNESERAELGGAQAGIERALVALKSLGRRSEPVGLNQLARELGIPKASLFRAFAAFKKAGLVAQDERGRYHLGAELVRLAFEYHERRDEVALIEPLLRLLSDRIRETAQFARLVDDEVVYMAKIEPVGIKVRTTSTVGGRNPAHCTGLGKALLAYQLQTEEAVADYIAQHGPLVKRTERTATTVEELHSELEDTRQRGFALDNEEFEKSVVCLAFPLFLASPTSPGSAVSIAGLAHRTSINELVALAPEVRELIEQHFEAPDITVSQVPERAASDGNHDSR
jgi:IclR family transcriptional regulator, acetate operon repressor